MTKWQAINLMLEVHEAYVELRNCERWESTEYENRYVEKKDALKMVLEQKLNPVAGVGGDDSE